MCLKQGFTQSDQVVQRRIWQPVQALETPQQQQHQNCIRNYTGQNGKDCDKTGPEEDVTTLVPSSELKTMLLLTICIPLKDLQR